jgi:hypothetical protein
MHDHGMNAKQSSDAERAVSRRRFVVWTMASTTVGAVAAACKDFLTAPLPRIPSARSGGVSAGLVGRVETFSGSAGAITGTAPWIAVLGTVNRDGSGNARPSGTGADWVCKHDSAAGELGHFAALRLSVVGATPEHYIGPAVRMSGTGGTANFYALLYNVTANTVLLSKFVNGVFQSALATWDMPDGGLDVPVVGDELKLVASSDTNPVLEGFQNGVSIGTFTDSTSPLSGTQVGFAGYADSSVDGIKIDQWEGTDGGGGGEPPPGPEPDILEDFSTYTSTANYLTDPRGIYLEGECFDQENNTADSVVAIDPTVGFGSSTKSLRYDWNSYATQGTGGNISRAFILPPGGVTNIWVEAQHKCTANFHLDNWLGQPNPPGVGYKFIFLAQNNGGAGRFAYEWTGDNPGNMSMYPNDAAWGGSEQYHFSHPFGIGDARDGNWHRYRIHVRLSGGDKLAGQIDDGEVFDTDDVGGFTTASTDIWNVQIGQFMNQRPVQVQQEWWGRVAIWLGSNDPGWGW